MSSKQEVAHRVCEEALLQAAGIHGTLERQLKSLRLKPFGYQFILEFALVKLAALSEHATLLGDREMASALEAEVEVLVSHRCTFEPTARDAFRRYREFASGVRSAGDSYPAKIVVIAELTDLFTQRLHRLTAALPEANGLFKRRVAARDIAVAASYIPELCLTVNNPAESIVFAGVRAAA